VKNLDKQPEEHPGVEGVEHSGSDGGEWGGPPRPGELRKSMSAFDGSKIKARRKDSIIGDRLIKNHEESW
jgi:hypothetical protein